VTPRVRLDLSKNRPPVSHRVFFLFPFLSLSTVRCCLHPKGHISSMVPSRFSTSSAVTFPLSERPFCPDYGFLLFSFKQAATLSSKSTPDPPWRFHSFTSIKFLFQSYFFLQVTSRSAGLCPPLGRRPLTFTCTPATPSSGQTMNHMETGSTLTPYTPLSPLSIRPFFIPFFAGSGRFFRQIVRI